MSLDRVRKLFVNENFNFQSDFDEFEREFNNELKHLNNLIPNSKKVLKKVELLYNHHPKTLKHSLMVAYDVKYIACELGYNRKVVSLLHISSLLHDIGKLNIFEDILNLPGPNELRLIWQEMHVEDYNYCIPMREQILLIDIIMYNAKKSGKPNIYMNNFDSWFEKNKIPKKFLNLPIMEYLRVHQKFTKSILENLNIDSSIVLYASSHHLYLFDEVQRKVISKECSIIEISDKFNAIVQTEGVREYARKKSRMEALIVIINGILNEFQITEKDFIDTNSFEKDIILVLVKRYFFDEIKRFLIPLIKQVLSYSKMDETNLFSARKCTLAIEGTLRVIELFENDVRFMSLDKDNKVKTLKKYFLNSLEKINDILDAL